MKIHQLLALCGIGASSLLAQALTFPKPSDVDPRLQTVEYTTDIVRVKVEIGRVTEIVLRPGEVVEDYFFGDRDAWWYADRGHIIRIKPKAKSPDTNARIKTNRANYWFDLDSTAKGPAAYQLTILYQPDPPPVATPMPMPMMDDSTSKTSVKTEGRTIKQLLEQPLRDAQGGNPAVGSESDAKSKSATQLFSALNPKLQFERMDLPPVRKVVSRVVNWNVRYAGIGSKRIEPTWVKDNGENTFIQFPLNQGQPAIFAVAPDGVETRLDYSLQDDVMVVNRVAQRFVLRHGEEALCLVNLQFNPTGQTTGTKTVSPNVQRTIKEDAR